jgi:hypothetical protein
VTHLQDFNLWVIQFFHYGVQRFHQPHLVLTCQHRHSRELIVLSESQINNRQRERERERRRERIGVRRERRGDLRRHLRDPCSRTKSCLIFVQTPYSSKDRNCALHSQSNPLFKKKNRRTTRREQQEP